MFKTIDIAILMCLLACFNLWLVNLPSPNVPVPRRGNITLIKVLLAVSLNSALYIKSLFLRGVLSRGRLPRHNHPTHQLFLLIIMHHASTLSIIPSPSSFLFSFVCSFIHSFIHLLIRSFLPSFFFPTLILESSSSQSLVFLQGGVQQVSFGDVAADALSV